MGKKLLAFLLIILVVPCAAAAAEPALPRIALVAGVSAYQHAASLPNTLNDARSVAAALTRIGFAVNTVMDPDRPALEAAVRRLGHDARGAQTAVFYYAGHAVEFGGHNWLVPAPADLHNERDLRFEALDVDAVLEQIDGQALVSLLILDSCRDNPFRQMLAAGSRGIEVGHGLAPPRAAAGTLVVYATAPGNVAADGKGPNSPFTAALLRHIETPGLEIRRMIAEVRKDVRLATNGRQIPWENSALEGDFFLKAATATAPPPDHNVEVAFWNSVKDTSDPAELRAYLTRFPDGDFAALARTRLARLTPKPGEPRAPVTGLEAELLAALSMITEGERESQARRYVRSGGGRALAVAPWGRKSWLVPDDIDDATAETVALEGCQIYTNEACVLVARGARVVPKPASGSWPLQPSARVSWHGEYDPARIPALRPKDRTTASVAGYAALPGPKALALHPWGRIFLGAGATQTEAEAIALKACNADPDRKGKNGPCFVYASGNRVVLPDRRTTAAR